MIQVLDYSAGYPGAGNIAARGYAGGMRYLRKEGASSVKPLTTAERIDYQKHQRDLGLIGQHVSKTRVLEGRAAGRHDAAWWLSEARACGVEPRAIYFAVDFDTVGPQQWAAVREYMLGCAEVVGLIVVGCYGEYDLLDYLFARGSITWGWQTYAWSTGHNQDNQPRHPRAHLFQRRQETTVGGIACDVNDVLKIDYGQTPPPHQEDDMSAEAERKIDIIHAQLVGDATGGADTPVDTYPGWPRFTTVPTGERLTTVDFIRSVLARLDQLAADVAELKARPAADVDEAALAEELAKRGINVRITAG